MGSKRRIDMFFLYTPLLFLLGVACQQQKVGLMEYARIADPDVVESSGVAVSRRFENVFWTHNDDGPPLVFAVGLDGEKIRSFELPVRNCDWEDIALDTNDNLYLLDNTSRDDDLHRTLIHVFPRTGPIQ